MAEANREMTALVNELCERTGGVTPWHAYSWSGRVYLASEPLNRIGVALPEPSEVQRIVAAASSGDEWDGVVAAVVRLKDGRYLAYETFYGPTGSGFYEDAYGGDADVWIGTLAQVRRMGLTNEGRRMLRLKP